MHDPQDDKFQGGLIGASAIEQQLFSHLIDHVRQESGLLEKYAQIGANSPSKALSYLVKLLLEDETRHHRLFMEMASSLKNDAELATSEPLVPRIDFDKVAESQRPSVVSELLEQEKQDERELKQLKRDLHDVRNTTLWGILVDLMLLDTAKHITLLRFVEDRMKSLCKGASRSPNSGP